MTPELLPVLKKQVLSIQADRVLYMPFTVCFLSVFKDGKIIPDETAEDGATSEKSERAASDKKYSVNLTVRKMILPKHRWPDFVCFLNHPEQRQGLPKRDDLVVLHVNTDEPGNILTEALKIGDLIEVKVENLALSVKDDGLQEKVKGQKERQG